MINRRAFEQQQKPQKKKSDECKVTVKKKKDGSVEKRISSSCTRQHLQALSGIEGE